MDNKGSDGTGCFRIKVRTDGVEFTFTDISVRFADIQEENNCCREVSRWAIKLRA